MILSLKGFYSIYAKKRNSHGQFKCIKKLKFTPKSCCLSAIMLCSIYFELFYLEQYLQLALSALIPKHLPNTTCLLVFSPLPGPATKGIAV